ncbi:hypothetical protein PQR37_37140 [Paraburkholderia nemoris]|uniref:hypothetical protein n=1 Tax=Paraburkholderia nemoris TaxID=2793076 RepID=UPI0038B6FB46
MKKVLRRIRIHPPGPGTPASRDVWHHLGARILAGRAASLALVRVGNACRERGGRQSDPGRGYAC